MFDLSQTSQEGIVTVTLADEKFLFNQIGWRNNNSASIIYEFVLYVTDGSDTERETCSSSQIVEISNIRNDDNMTDSNYNNNNYNNNNNY